MTEPYGTNFLFVNFLLPVDVPGSPRGFNKVKQPKMESDASVGLVIIFRVIAVFVAQTQQLLPPTLLLPKHPPPPPPQSWEDLLSLTWLMEFFENAYPFTLDKGPGNLMCFSWNRRT